MSPDPPMSGDFDAWFSGLAYTFEQQFVPLTALVIIVAVGIAIAMLALVVASMSDAPLDMAALSDSAAARQLPQIAVVDWFTRTCPWVCPWQPRRPAST